MASVMVGEVKSRSMSAQMHALRWTDGEERAAGRIAQVIGRMGDEIGAVRRVLLGRKPLRGEGPDQVEWFIACLAERGVKAQFPVAK